MEREVPFLGHAAVPEDGLRTVLQNGRKTSRIVQNGDVLSTKAVIFVLDDVVFLCQLCKVKFMRIALKSGDVPVDPSVFLSQCFLLYIIARNDIFLRV